MSAPEQASGAASGQVSDLAPDLAYVALVVDDPEIAAAIFEKDFALPRQDFACGDGNVPVIAMGRSALAFFRPDDPFLGPGAKKGVHHAAIAAADPKAVAEASGLAVENGAAGGGRSGNGVSGDGVSEGLGGRPQVALARDATCGVGVRLTQSLGLVPASSAMVERIDHLGVASADNKEAREVFINRLGCVYESQQTDSEVETISENFTSNTYNYIYHTRPPRLVGSMSVIFITVGDTEFEFIQDLTVQAEVDEARHDSAGNTRGDRSAIVRYIATRGAGLHHIAFKTPDVAGSLARLREAGHRTIDTLGRPGSRRALIGFMHPTMVGGVLMHFVQREEV